MHLYHAAIIAAVYSAATEIKNQLVPQTSYMTIRQIYCRYEFQQEITCLTLRLINVEINFLCVVFIYLFNVVSLLTLINTRRALLGVVCGQH